MQGTNNHRSILGVQKTPENWGEAPLSIFCNVQLNTENEEDATARERDFLGP
jgi:hypothetical protein